MALSQSTVLKLYHTVIDDVIAGVRDPFLDDGVDEQVLQELKQVWTNKLMASKAVELASESVDQPTPPSVLSNSTKSASKAKARNSAASSNVDNMNGKANGSSSQSMPAPPAAVIGLDPNKIVPIQITLPAMPGTPNAEQRVLTISVPASALQENQLHHVITGPIITSIMPLPPQVASNVLQQHVNAALQNSSISNSLSVQKQMDGAADTSDEGSDISDDHLDNDDDEENDKSEEENDEGGAEEEPLNSEDDVTDEDSAELFETDNVVVCQYDKITRSRNKWKFYLKDGIMNVNGKDFVFQKSNGDAEW